ncbi:uncharacterized protein F4807DRAFT_422439 [Annulohypoxylon truncatum]|uniref:uncharacterized protein n=1 Tax=Annulohypoxylon truncatum TaxID=327061 RepID=UPI002007EDFF|nr:uncharacterized protein F4807DRAFT_422439 [Annulohypoxylon truncatum]KAI1210731.1 hypothetical protein F4807DRAFT_422439 [Annulohypoxylon truncatum]
MITEWVTSYVTAVTVETTSPHNTGPGMSVASVASASSTSSESTVSHSTAAITSENRMFCPDPHHPGAWTLCAPDHDKATALGVISTAVPNAPAESSARRCSFNLFTLIKTVCKGIWKLLFHHDEARAEAMRHVERYNVLELGCRCNDLQRLALTMVDIIEVQQRMLEEKDELIAHQKKLVDDQKLVMDDQGAVIEWNKGVFVDVVAFISNLKNDTANTLKKVHEMNGGNTELQLETDMKIGNEQ